MYEFLDIEVADVVLITHYSFDDWSRPTKTPRYANGLIYVCEGSIKYDFGDCVFDSHKGDVLYFPKGRVYSGEKIEGPNSFYIIDFELANPDQSVFLPLQIESVPEEIKKSFERVIDLWKSDEPLHKLRCRSEIYQLFCKIFELNEGSSFTQCEHITRALKYIQDNYQNPKLYVREISEHVFISESHMRRLFIENLCKTPIEYLQSLRLERAKEMLLYSHDSMEQIAEACGYSSLFYFCKAFKKSEGITPSAFRKKYG